MTKMKKPRYLEELKQLQLDLVKLQRHVIKCGHKVAILFEGRDAAGKDGAIKRIVKHLSPRDVRIVALGKPSERDRASWYFQRFTSCLPAEGEMVLFNRSWYNRAGVERVMGFSSGSDYTRFIDDVGDFERLLVHSGIHLLKYYLDISFDEQSRRLAARRQNPLTQWKTSPIDSVALEKWDEYSQARDDMLMKTGSTVPWRVIPADDKRRARLTIIRDILYEVPCPELAGRVEPPTNSQRIIWTAGNNQFDRLFH